MYLVTILIAIIEGPNEGAVTGFAAGLAQDFLLNQPKGITALTLTLVGYAAGLARQYIVSPSPLLPTILVGVGTAAGVTFYQVVAFLLGQLEETFAYAVRVTLLTAAVRGDPHPDRLPPAAPGDRGLAPDEGGALLDGEELGPSQGVRDPRARDVRRAVDAAVVPAGARHAGLRRAGAGQRRAHGRDRCPARRDLDGRPVRQAQRRAAREEPQQPRGSRRRAGAGSQRHRRAGARRALRRCSTCP